MLTYGIPPEFRGGVHLFIQKPPYAIGSVPSFSGHAIAYRWRSLPRVRRHRASKPQGSSERVLPWQVTMNRLMCAYLSHRTSTVTLKGNNNQLPVDQTTYSTYLYHWLIEFLHKLMSETQPEVTSRKNTTIWRKTYTVLCRFGNVQSYTSAIRDQLGLETSNTRSV